MHVLQMKDPGIVLVLNVSMETKLEDMIAIGFK